MRTEYDFSRMKVWRNPYAKRLKKPLTMNKRKFRTFDDVQLEHYKKHPKELKGYVRVAFEEYQKDGNEKAFLAVLSKNRLI